MNLTPLERRALRQLGRVKRVLKKAYRQKTKQIVGTVKKNVKKVGSLNRIGFALLVAPLIIPVGVVAAGAGAEQATADQPAFETELTLSFDATIVKTPEKQVSIDVTESEYQKRLRERAAVIAAQARAKTQPVAIKAKPVSSTASYEERAALAQRAAAAFGIDWKVLFAVWQVESGQRMYFTGGSSAGARGPCQFMPGTWRAYASDGNGDGVADINDARDCLYGSAKLLARNGAAAGDYRRALFAYNHSISYVNKVLGLAASY